MALSIYEWYMGLFSKNFLDKLKYKMQLFFLPASDVSLRMRSSPMPATDVALGIRSLEIFNLIPFISFYPIFNSFRCDELVAMKKD